MNVQLVLILAAVGVALYFVSKLLFKADTAVEERRRRAIQLAAWCQTNGLPDLSKLLSSYAVGDYSGVAFQVRNLSDVVADGDQAKAAVDRFLKVQLDKQIQTVEGRDALLKYVQEKFNAKIVNVNTKE